MTIKQQGGIFGRNPTFNDVTVDGTLTSASISVTALDDVTIGSSTPASGTFTDLAISQELEFQMSADAFGAGSSYAYILRTGSGGSAPFTQAGALVYQPRTSTTDGRSNHKFYTGDPLTLALDLKPNQNAHFGGNIVLPSGQGIDFSATSGTGTSELFDDYEEGSHTVSLTVNSGTASLSKNILQYTKIGRLVHVYGMLRVSTVSSPSGAVSFTLPFTAASSSGSDERGTRFSAPVNLSASLNANEFELDLAAGTATVSMLNTSSGTISTTNVGESLQANTTIPVNITYAVE
jgi:hypothetical protein